MSVLDLPRIHFRGVARIHAPTGDRNALPIFDLSTHRVYRDGRPVPVGAPARDFQAHLRRALPCDLRGADDPDGPYSRAAGWDLGGNGHFSWDARITAVQLAPGERLGDDPLIGRAIDLWGHHNPYLGTTFNRARIVRGDPTSPWTTQILAGRLTLGRSGASVDVGNLFTGAIEGAAPARFLRRDHLRDLPPHWLGDERATAALHQFVIARDALEFLPGADVSPGLRALAGALRGADVDGLVVRFSLSNLCAGDVPDAPGFADVSGTIAVHRAHELRSFPAGRLLVPVAGAGERLGPIVVHAFADRISLDLPIAVPRRGRAAVPGAPTCAAGPPLDLGRLDLRLAGGELVATIPRALYADADATAGVLDLPVSDRALLARLADAPLELHAAAHPGRPLLREQELVLATDDTNLVLEPGGPAAPVTVRSFWRGRPAPAAGVRLRAVYNPHAVPGWRHDAPDPDRYRYPRADEVALVAVPTAPQSTGPDGRAALTIAALRPGAGRIVLIAESPHPTPPHSPGDDPFRSYDRDDRLGLWGHAGCLYVRVLPDDGDLAAIPDEAVDFPLLYRAVFHHYELLYPFMAEEVFSLADRCKVETYARLVWQMADPRNADRTYYMPPTRDLSRARTRLFRAYLRNVEASAPVAAPVAAARPGLTSRAALIEAVRDAVAIEQRIMLQYMFAAYSIPNYEHGRRLVACGRWTAAELRLACGDGEEAHEQGLRGALLAIAHEEMIHFLLCNNLLRALGEPFYTPAPAAPHGPRLAALPGALAPMSRAQLHTFIALESPAADDASISGLYRQIRAALVARPGLIVAAMGRGGGEHHLFLSDAHDRRHPDYQLEIDDLGSALFALDFITGQGEGAPAGDPLAVDSHHQRLRRIAADLARHDAEAPPAAPLWEPAHPALRDPTRRDRPGANLVTDPLAREVMAIVDETYAVMLGAMALHFHASPGASLRRSRWMNAAIDLMTGVLRPLSILLMCLPSGVAGRTAGPGFELDAVPPPAPTTRAALEQLAARLEQLAARARACPPVPAAAHQMLAFHAATFARMAEETA